jgi:hypothetical protein
MSRHCDKDYLGVIILEIIIFTLKIMTWTKKAADINFHLTSSSQPSSSAK